MKIEDGEGSGKLQGVNSENRAKTAAVVREIRKDHVINATAWVILAPPATLTTATASALLYFKNTGPDILLIYDILLELGTSVSGTGKGQIAVTFNPTGGTLITDEVAGAASNLNIGSSKAPNATIYSGGEGKTVTGGSGPSGFFNPATADRNLFLTPGNSLAVPQGASVSITVTPPAGNTSFPVTAKLIIGQVTGGF